MMTSDDECSRPPRRARGKGRMIRVVREAITPRSGRHNRFRDMIPDRRVMQPAERVRGVYDERHCVYAIISSRAHGRFVEKDTSE